MDLSETIAPKSDQLNAEDMLTGPRVVTVEKVTRGGSAEQPVDIHLVEFPGRPFKPCKSMRRVLVAAWGSDAKGYTGRRMMLYNDPSVRFGGQSTGGIRISALSDIEQRITLALTVTRGKRAPFVVEPLPDAPPSIDPDAVAEFERRIADASSIQELDAVARDLKARDLGSHRARLIAAGRDQRAALSETDLIAEITTLLAKVAGPDEASQLDWLAAWRAPEDISAVSDLTAEEAPAVLALLKKEVAQ